MAEAPTPGSEKPTLSPTPSLSPKPSPLAPRSSPKPKSLSFFGRAKTLSPSPLPSPPSSPLPPATASTSPLKWPERASPTPSPLAPHHLTSTRSPLSPSSSSSSSSSNVTSNTPSTTISSSSSSPSPSNPSSANIIKTSSSTTPKTPDTNVPSLSPSSAVHSPSNPSSRTAPTGKATHFSFSFSSSFTPTTNTTTTSTSTTTRESSSTTPSTTTDTSTPLFSSTSTISSSTNTLTTDTTLPLLSSSSSSSTSSSSTTLAPAASRSPRQGILRRIITVIGSEVRLGSNRPRSKSSFPIADGGPDYHGFYRDERGVQRPRAASTPAPFGEGGVPSIEVTGEMMLIEEDGTMAREGSDCGSSVDGGSVHSAQHSPNMSVKGQRKRRKWLDISSGAIPKSFRVLPGRLKSTKQRAEIEAADTCHWLRATGFPQYAQMFEEGRFPVDLALVQKDHDFLDQDLLDSVVRRLKILNKCSSMKIEAPIHRSCDESEDEDQCAISSKWKYMRSSRRWSRRLTGEEFPELELCMSPPIDSTTSHIHTHSRLNSSHESVTTTDSERNEGYTSTSSFDSPAIVKKAYGNRAAASASNQSLPVSNAEYKTSTPIQADGDMNGPRSAIIKISSPITVRKDPTADINGLHSSKDHMKGAKSLLKRLDSLKGRRGGSQRRKHKSGDTLEISGPIVQDNAALNRKIELFNCVDLSTAKAQSCRYPALVTPPATRRRNAQRRANNNTKRMGRVFSEPSSPMLHRKLSLDVVKDLEVAKMALTNKINNNESKSCEDVFLSDMEDVCADLIAGLNRDKHISSERSSNVTGTTGTGRSFMSTSSNDSWQGQYGHESGDWPDSPGLITSPLDALTSGTPHRLRSPSMYDNMPPALHSSLDNLPDAEIEVAETELMRQIYNLKNIGHFNNPLEHTPSTRRSASVSTCTELDMPQLPTSANPAARDIDTEKLDILTNISRILMKEKQLDASAESEPEAAPLRASLRRDRSDSIPRRDRSNSLPNAGPEGIRESIISLEADAELEAEVMGLSTELERLLSGINESIHELEENLKKSGTGESNVSASSSQISSPVNSQVSSPYASPYASPLPSPIPTPDFNANKKQCEETTTLGAEIKIAHHHHDKNHNHDDTGVGGLSTGQDTTGSEREMTPGSCEEEMEEEDTAVAETTEEKNSSSTRSPWKERRDSGVGNSLTRPNSGRRPRIRWHSFQKSHRPSLNSRPFQVSSLSIGQLMILRKLSLLKLTAVMERYSVSHRSGWTWMVPRFMKRTKVGDVKDRVVFGVPLLHHLQRTGQPLPQTILYAMRYLRRQAGDAVGLFRKPGVRSRIQALKKMNEANPDTMNYEGMLAYDVADMLKQYFRELPEPLLTPKLSETFISLFTSSVPKELRIPVMQAAILLMPDENREVLQSLLLFLSDIASQSDTNQMTAYNLAVCFAPSLFQLNGMDNMRNAMSPRQRRKTGGKPDQKELIENVAANECLALMIRECKKLFMVPEDLLAKCHFSYMDLGEPVTLEELGRKKNDESGDYKSYLESCIQGLLKESREKFKGWVSCAPVDKVEVSYKKVGDGHPLRLWKCTTDIEAPPAVILQRVLRERHLWDEDLLKWRSVEKIDSQTEVFEYVINAMAPHPTKSFSALRSWRTNLAKGACVLVSTSIEHPDTSLSGNGSVRGTELASRFLIEPCGTGKSRLTHISRVDTKGRTMEWYNKAYGHMLANTVAHIRNLYTPPGSGPETKV